MNRIETTLLEMGVPANLLGFKYLHDAIQLVLDNPSCLYSVTDELYPGVAKLNSTTSTGAERGIRHSVEVAFVRIDTETIHKYFGNSISPDKGKPTNSEFIAAATLALKECGT